MAYVISASLEQDPIPYPSCDVREDLAPGQTVVIWNDIDSEPIPPEWQPQSVLHADYVPEANYTPDNPDISYISGEAPCVSVAIRDMIEALEPNVHQFFLRRRRRDPGAAPLFPERLSARRCHCGGVPLGPQQWRTTL